MEQVLSQARDRLREYSLHNNSTITPVGRPPTTWKPPGKFQYKINFYGALFQSENCAGIVVIIRNELGQVMVSLSLRIPLLFTAIEVEALATQRGLKLVLETGFGRVVLEGDSQILIKALIEDTYSLANFGHIVTDIPYLASHFSIIDY